MKTFRVMNYHLVDEIGEDEKSTGNRVTAYELIEKSLTWEKAKELRKTNKRYTIVPE